MWPLAPLGAVWAARAARLAWHKGRALTPPEQEMAARMGVAAPERVRVMVAPEMPWPGPRWLHRLVSRLGFPATESVGLCLGHAIFLHPAWAEKTEVLAHELVHTAQYERLGGVRPFLRRYLAECLAFGYVAAPLEREARFLSATL